ncbi:MULTISPECIES: aldo/keto reductase [unclassified Aureimonas]|uniref:aldo/keto reductase n=1 Tax=unclassified Aureimonas TaxID=2615206 RepID=UPI0006F7C277|nr:MULTISPECIES: aldo/keto reductase [unclassified Aureimonas]KQT54024.1 hypothetical protein ASG62_12450 [Aureimonas sp. Leaf427]KQT71536.1 hypothetical protein ASG54_18710 [Aureimonas sp. Leaf460]
MKTVTLPDGTEVSALGQGTWMMAERRELRRGEIDALRAGLDVGMTLIDTAEIYADGASETLVGEALAGRRDRAYLVSKVAPSHADRAGTIRACEASLKRLGTDRIDLYLLHWRGGHPLEATLEGFEALVESGKIRHWGVSNFDTADMEELLDLPGGERCATNQILYNPEERGTEFDLLPFLSERGIPAMAYSPIGQGGALLRHPALERIARRHKATPAQIALAFALEGDEMIAIPKAGSPAHALENAAADAIALTREDCREIDAAFPPPQRKQRLAVI